MFDKEIIPNECTIVLRLHMQNISKLMYAPYKLKYAMEMIAELILGFIIQPSFSSSNI